MEIDKSKLNVIAFYLPQYHTIPENDAAYGKGFTEWTNVKKAEPLFEGHRQPRVPLSNNYYCLLDDGKTLEGQAKLAKENGISGFCYYHYYFSHGKKLLEKPLEEMLLNKKIDMPFCLCWANENWSRRWDGGNNEVIAYQEYDRLEDIDEHIKYICGFMDDVRYMTIDGEPIFIIYRPGLIPHLKKYIKKMRESFTKYGYPKVKILIQQAFYYLEGKKLDLFDGYIQYQPNFVIASKMTKYQRFKSSIKKMLKSIGLEKINTLINKKNIANKELEHRNYIEDWESIINYKPKDKRLIAGGFVDFDNTPRVKTGLVYDNVSVENFDYYFGKLTDKVKKEYELPIIFMMAWNEWGEGSYLEPDTDYGTGYLNAIKKYVTNW